MADSTSKTDSATSSTWIDDKTRDEVQMRSIKIVDIGYIAMLYFIFAIIFSAFFDKLLGEWKEDEESKKGMVRIALELLGIIWMYGVTVYFVRNLVELIPSPFSHIPLSNPKLKFDHKKLKELSSATVFTLVLLGTSRHFRKKLDYFYDRFTQRK